MLTLTAAITVYKQMVLTFFNHLDILIDGSTKYYIDKLQHLHFRGIQIIYLYNMNGTQITKNDRVKLQKQLKSSFLSPVHTLYVIYLQHAEYFISVRYHVSIISIKVRQW